MAEKGRVCVTGAGGYVASWLVKLLLSNNYAVHGTVRDPRDEKNIHLKNLEKASENLELFRADLLDYNSLLAAVVGCDGVFHVASPAPSSSVPNPEVEVIEPAVSGTVNVLKACSEANVKRIVFVSSIAAVGMSPDSTKDQVLDESFWSDKQYYISTNNWYCLSKTEAEIEAWDFAKRSRLNMVSVCPTLTLGPMLQRTVNSSSWILVKILKEGYEELENKLRLIVDVRDLAEALLLVYERPEAEGRYICMAHMVRLKELVEMLRRDYPNYNYPKNFKEGKAEKTSSEKLQRLGWSYRPLEETLVDSVECYRQNEILD